jgi:hypothetical protein
MARVKIAGTGKRLPNVSGSHQLSSFPAFQLSSFPAFQLSSFPAFSMSCPLARS